MSALLWAMAVNIVLFNLSLTVVSSYDFRHNCKKWHVDRKEMDFLALGIHGEFDFRTWAVLNLGISKFGLVEFG
jgi:hypothetical protein